MVAVRLSPFGGMIPAVDDRLLPDTNAAFAQNTWVYEGTVIGLPSPVVLRTNSTADVSKVYRIPNNYVDAQHLTDSIWIEFTNIDTDVVRSLVVNDTFDRYYWASPADVPRYNTRARIAAGQPAWMLGIPAPTITAVTATGGAGAATSRAYVTTFVSTYGEEGPISNAFLRNGKVDDTWTLTFAVADPNDLGVNRTLSKRNIYRTITAVDGSTTYFFVAQINATVNTYADTASDATISANAILESTSWSAPPSDLQGITSISNGMVAGFRENEVWFCEPFRMHAWPAQYVLTVEYPIVGFGVDGQTLVILTQGYPHTATGINPSSMSIIKLSGLLPCTSRGGIVSSPEGVYYPSPQGLILVSSGGLLNVTKELVRKDKWDTLVPLPTLRATRLAHAYYGFGSARFGVFQTDAFQIDAFQQDDFLGARQGTLIDPTSQSVAFSTLTSDIPIVNIFTDAWSGELFMIKGNQTFWLDISNPNSQKNSYLWRSKIFQPSDKKNFQAVKIFFNVPPATPTQNPVRDTNATIPTLANDQYGILRVYADSVLVTTREIRTTGEMMRILSGFKADFWQFEIEARVEVLSLQAATSPSELRTV